MSRIKSVLNTIMNCFLCYFIGHCVFVFWDYKTSPELYALQSAPWYTSILFNGVITFVVVVVCTLIKVALKYMENKDKSEKEEVL